MPEGDTIFRAARALEAMLAGKTIRSALSSVPGVDAASLVGRAVCSVSAEGKNLLMRFDDGRLLHTHMRMTGSWRLYRPDGRVRAATARARVILEVDDAVAVCFNAPVVALRRGDVLPDSVRSLGPDILKSDVDLAEVLQRFRANAALPLGEALLQQQLVAGIGNVYKSETLFACQANPFRAIAELDDAALLRILNRAREFMRANLSQMRRRFRITGEGSRIWVYRREGLGCHRCGTSIAMRRQGSTARSTYYCPTCQGVPAVNP